MSSMTRGPLPPSVYWRRRLILLSVALLLVVGIAKLLGGGGDGSDSEGTASPAAAEASESSSSASASSSPSETPTQTATQAPSATSAPPAPTGPCSDEDVVVTPSVTDAAATEPATIVLTLRTQEAEACTWELSSDSLQLRINSKRGPVYTTVDCPRMIQPSTVVVRRDFDTVANLTWNTRLSDAGCTPRTEWARPGSYRVTAAALGGEPATAEFELGTPTASPTPTESASESGSPSESPSESASESASDSGSPSESASESDAASESASESTDKEPRNSRLPLRR